MVSVAPIETVRTVQIILTGHVQGVGFRPFVFRMANAHGLTGQVLNRVGEVEIVVTGPEKAIRSFTTALIDEAPPLSNPVLQSVEPMKMKAFDEFAIAPSSANAEAKIFVPPDYFMCDDCRGELEDPADRRFGYPFINCTQCGPRYTLIARMPYDRPNTSMADFPLCDACTAEYEDPADRRFHAEPVACPECGPRVRFETPGEDGKVCDDAALEAALDHLRRGHIVAVKGVGGYHLLCDATDDAAVDRLRERKARPDKPLAVMFPTGGADSLSEVCKAVDLGAQEATLLASPMRPIVLCPRRQDTVISDRVAPGLAELGVFLPYAPLHHRLLATFGRPLVATSGNLSGEPVLTDDADAARRLPGIADAFLHHNRPILRPADDPVFRSLGGKPRPIRIGRGSAPLELELPSTLPEPVLAVGAHMKGTVAIAWQDRAVVSPHIGEMDSPRSMQVFETVIDDLQRLYDVRAARVICDGHPGYATSRWAREQGVLPVSAVWHHHAHASALAAEYPFDGQWLVFAWDGVGLGPDGTLWGGEALVGRPGQWRRAGSMRPFRLPGGERAGREPWRSAASLHWEAGLDYAPAPDIDGIARSGWQRGINAPWTSAAGRLFDAAAAIVCDADKVSYEAAGPMLLESVCTGSGEAVPLPIEQDAQGILRSDWSPLLPVLSDERLSRGRRSAVFHASMAQALCDQVARICVQSPAEHIGLTGGVFQNRALVDLVRQRLAAQGREVFLPQSLPCNDAAISFGQVAEFAAVSHGVPEDG
jgi:hydrogenase maturation protein HypF